MQQKVSNYKKIKIILKYKTMMKKKFKLIIFKINKLKLALIKIMITILFKFLFFKIFKI